MNITTQQMRSFNMYKKRPTYMGQENTVLRTTDGACIPLDPDNTDYQAYLAWLAEGGIPEEADDVSSQ